MATDTMQKSVIHYENMRDSGVEWIGAVPSDWSIYTLGQLAIQVKNKNSQLQENNLLSLSYGKIKRKNIETKEGLLPASFDNYNIIDAGDIVLRLTDLQNDHTSLRVGLATEKGIITSAYVTLRPKNLALPAFMYYVLHAFDIRKGFYGMGAGVRQGLKFEEVKQIKLGVPSPDVQQDIVDYLNQKCALIESFIVDAKASIEEYKAWKSSIIYEAVTKGLDRNVEMKDSGVDIIGYIPKDWTLRRLKFLCSVMTGNQDTQNAVDNGIYPFYVRSPIVERSNVYTYEGEGVLMAGDGAGAGRVFHHAFGKYAIHQRVYCFHDFHNMLPDYFYYFMSELFKHEMDKGSAQSTVPSVRMPMIANFQVCLPPIDEQRHIVKAIEKNCKLIDSVIAEKEQLIVDLADYKKSLIFEVVTGKRRIIN